MNTSQRDRTVSVHRSDCVLKEETAMPKTRTLIRFSNLAFVAGLLFGDAHAQLSISSLSPHATGPVHTYETRVGALFIADTYTLSFPDTPAARLADHSHLSVTVNAPDGMMFVVQPPPAGYHSAQLNCAIEYGQGTGSAPYATISNPSLFFDMVSGNTSAWENWVLDPIIPNHPGSELLAQASVPVTDGFSFRSMTFSFNYANAGLAQTPLASLEYAVLEYVIEFHDEHDDVNPVMSLVPIPEPDRGGVLGAWLVAAMATGRFWQRRRRLPSAA